MTTDLPIWQSKAESERVSRQFIRHLLGLFIIFSQNSQAKWVYYTGFALYHLDNLYWCTAGHNIREIEQLRADRNVVVKTMQWIDCGETAAGDAVPVPVHRPSELEVYADDGEGEDFGIVIIRGIDGVSLLENDRLWPFNEKIWMDQESSTPKGYYVVGFPGQGINHDQPIATGTIMKRDFTANVACLPTFRIQYENLDEEARQIWRSREAFYGQILSYSDSPGGQPSSIKGMSGGPILSIEDDPQTRQLRYRLFGVQSRWFESRRVIQAVSTRRMLQKMNEWGLIPKEAK